MATPPQPHQELMQEFSYPIRGLLLVLLLLACACDRVETKTGTSFNTITLPPAIDPDSTAASSTSPTTVGEQQAQVFAEQWVKAILEEDADSVRELLAWREIMITTIEPFSLKKEIRESVVRAGIAGADKICRHISKPVIDGGDYQLVRIDQRAGDLFALFRLLHQEGTLNYHLLRLRNVRGRVRADQFFVAASGERLADTLRKIYTPAMQNQNLSKPPTAQQKLYLANLKTIKQMELAFNAGDFEGVRKLYQGLSAELQQNKMALIYRLKSIEDESDYQVAVDEFLNTFPGHPACGLVALEAGTVLADPNLIETSHRILDEWTGGDAYLDLLTGFHLLTVDRVERALELTDSIDPETIRISTAHHFKADLALAAEDYAELLKQLRTLRDDYGYELQDLTTIEDYAGFVASEEFQQWQADSAE